MNTTEGGEVGICVSCKPLDGANVANATGVDDAGFRVYGWLDVGATLAVVP